MADSVNRVSYSGAAVEISSGGRAFPNPPTAAGGDVSSWDSPNGALEEFELTIMSGVSSLQLAAGAMLVAEETHDIYPEESNAVTPANATNDFTYSSHGFYTGDGPVRLDGTAGDVPLDLSATAEYYVIRSDANTFQVATSRANALAGTAETFSDDGTSVTVHWVTGIKSTTDAVEAVVFADDELTLTAHGLTLAQVVQVQTDNTLPDPLVVDTDYYVIVIDDDTIQLASTAENATAGTPITLTDGGTGNHDIVKNDFAATSATQYVKFKILNDGNAIDLTDEIAYREMIAHRPGVTAYHLVATLDDFAPVTATVRGLFRDN